MDLSNYSIEDLRKEIIDRDSIKEEEKDDSVLYVFMYGSEGCEGIQAFHSEKDMEALTSMKLRARFNSHRNIKLYSIKTSLDKDKFYQTIDKFPKLFINKAMEINF